MNIKDCQGLAPEKISSIKTRLDNSPLLKFLKAEIELLSPGFARVRIPFRPDFLQGFGVVQGGIIATAGDTAAGIAFMTLLEPNEILSTVDLKMNFLAPMRGGDIFSEARIIQRGMLISLGEFEVKTFEGVLIAKGLTTLTAKVSRDAGK